ncbi:MAG: 6-phosphogluconate dehydrogenase NAD-binding protein [Frankiales bacterium]|jgi:3-hydroxyisobutyrate dehydrogenase|nr:6-phosphogluconate dehydrogenase NAD-binding protein [Frankiales bacterium]
MRVAFLGLGRMGVAMSRHVLIAGHDLVVWNRTPGKADELIAAGATEAKTPGEAADGADAVVLVLFGPDSVREVLPQVVRQGLLVIDSTTIGPDAAHEFGRLCTEAGARYVDAPVAGSVGPATDGTLGVLAGAAEEDWPDAEPLLQLWGDPARVRRVGPVGAGSALKLVVNQGIGVLAAGLGEALKLSSELGLDRRLVLDVLGMGAYSWTLNQKRSMVEASDYSGTQFSADLLAKDLDLAVSAARDAELEVTRAALAAVRKTLDAGHSGEDYAAVIGHLADEGEPNSH